MILKSVKTAAETGIGNLEIVTVDKQITEVIIGKLRIRKGENYNKALEVLVEAPFDQEERYRLVGKIDGFPNAVTYHATKYDAESAGSRLEDAGAKTEIERVDVLIDHSGQIAGEVNGEPLITGIASADIPF